MIKFENVILPSYDQWRSIILSVRNPMNSWDKSDSKEGKIGIDDLTLMTKLSKGGPVHAKYRRMIVVYVDVTAPLYWWKEFDTYKVGTVANSCSTMHKIHEKAFTLDDFSCEHLTSMSLGELRNKIRVLNLYRWLYVNWDEQDDNTKNALLVGLYDGKEYQRKDAWWQLIQLLPTSYNQKRTIMLNYEVINNIRNSRADHKLDEWREFCKWTDTLPYIDDICPYRKENKDGHEQ